MLIPDLGNPVHSLDAEPRQSCEQSRQGVEQGRRGGLDFEKRVEAGFEAPNQSELTEVPKRLIGRAPPSPHGRRERVGPFRLDTGEAEKPSHRSEVGGVRREPST